MKIGQSKRQGDVLVVRRKSGTVQGKPAPRDDRGRVVLAEGEATGHAHCLLGEETVQLLDEMGNQALKIAKADPLVHEEHAPHTFAPGEFDVVRQYEFDPAEVRRVSD